MDIKIIQGDIAFQEVDVLVNTANRDLAGGYGVDGAIRAAAGPEFKAECKFLGKIEIGRAKITRGHNLLANLVVHTVGPNFSYNPVTAPDLLESCYQNSLILADEYKCKTVAFPSISTGKLGYPVDKAAKIAINTVCAFKAKNITTVTFCLLDDATYQAYLAAFSKK